MTREITSGLFVIHSGITEGALIMEALSELPFKMVFELIGKLNRQANEIDSERSTQSVVPLTVSRAELRLIIRALGDMPYQRVQVLLDKLNQQIREQLDGDPSENKSLAYD